MYHRYLKRPFDLVVALLLLALLIPFFLLIALVIVCTSPGPVLFRQPRIGLFGKEFTIFKFRTMHHANASSEQYFTEKGDKRITSFGGFLRKWSLDELPQLLNVVRGEMSLVGPRPEVPQQKSLYTEREFYQRHQVRPGITGLAQVSGRHHMTARRRKHYDIFYAKRKWLSLDLFIIVKTVPVIVKGSF